MKSSSLFVRASSLCMRNSERVRRQMSRPSDGGGGMVVLNSAGNQLVRLNRKKPMKDYAWQRDFSAISEQLNLCAHKHRQKCWEKQEAACCFGCVSRNYGTTVS